MGKQNEYGRRFTVTVSALAQAGKTVELMACRCGLEEDAQLLCSLLFEEISAVVRTNLEPDDKVSVRISAARHGVSVTLRMNAKSDFLRADMSPTLSEGEEIEQKIRNAVLASNSDKINARFNEGKGRLEITISIGSKQKKSIEDELEAFYAAHAGNPPAPWAQIRFLIKQRFWAFFLSFLIKVGRSLPMIVIPIITANIIDIVNMGHVSGNLKAFLLNIGIGVLSLLLHALFAYLDASYFRVLCRTMSECLRNVMVRKLQLLSMSFHSESRAGIITNKILNSVDAIEESLKILFSQLGTLGVYSLAAIIITLVNCPVMALFYVLFIPLAVIMARVFRKPIGKQNKELRQTMSDMSAAVTEMLGMVEITRAHGLQENEVSRLSRHTESIQSKGKKLDITNEVFGSMSWITLQFFQLLALAFSAYLASHGTISIGMIAMFQSYFSATVTRLSSFIDIVPQFSRGIDACRSISEVLCIDNDEHKGRSVPPAFNGSIVFSHVGYTYESEGVEVFKDINLNIPARSSIAITGGSGSGKSTILKLILGFILPKSGDVVIDGISIKDISLSSYRKHIAVVPQHPMLFSGTLYSNLTYGAPVYVSRPRVMEVMRKVGLGDYVESLPSGLDSHITESGSNLSLGEMQRLSIARALLRDPAVVILDEPTSALDRESEERIMEILKDISGTCTIVMVTHRLSTAEGFDSVVVLDHGTIVPQGKEIN